MTVVRRLVVLTALVFIAAAGSAFASAANLYITQSGSPSGNCTANVQTPAFFNSSANWGSGSTQIGPGTTVLLCGTFTFASGGNGLTVQGSGTSGNPIKIKLDTGAILQAPYFGGNSNSVCTSQPCGGGISILGLSYITIDGQSSGIIQNTANGSSLANQQPSVGVYVSGDHILVKNLIVQNIYNNTAAESTSQPGFNSADLLIDNLSTNVEVCNNYLNNAHQAITGFVQGSSSYVAGPTNGCADTQAAAGVNIYNNTVQDHGWQIQLMACGVVSYYGNDFSGWSNWFYPTANPYHTDGIFLTGQSTTCIQTAYIYNNYGHGDFVGGSPTGFVHCAVNGLDTSGLGSSCYIFNNIFVGTGGTATAGTAIWMHAGSIGPHYVFNNTFEGFCCDITEEGDASIVYTLKNNIFNTGPAATGGTWGYLQTSGPGAPVANLTSNYNDFYTTSGSYGWNWGGGNGIAASSLASWQSASLAAGNQEDANSVNANPNLTSSYTLNSGSPAIGAGANLTGLGIAALNVGPPQTFGVNSTCGTGCVARPSSGAWDAGAYPAGSNSASNSAPPPPQGVTATVNP